MKTEIMSLSEMLQSEEYQSFESDTLLNPQYHIINNTDVDVDLMKECNAEGMFGVSHQDFINCWRDYLSYSNLSEGAKENIGKEIDSCEEWHVKNGSINTII